jgi:hypothetical protein
MRTVIGRPVLGFTRSGHGSPSSATCRIHRLTAACSEGSGTEVEDGLDVEDEDITPGVDPGEEPVLEEEDEEQ